MRTVTLTREQLAWLTALADAEASFDPESRHLIYEMPDGTLESLRGASITEMDPPYCEAAAAGHHRPARPITSEFDPDWSGPGVAT